MFRVLIHVSLSSADIVIHNNRVLLNKPCRLLSRSEPYDHRAARVCIAVVWRVTGVCTVLFYMCILSITWSMQIQTRSIIHLLLYTIQFIFLSSHVSLHSTLSALPLLLSRRIFAVSIACPCSQSDRATTASPALLPGRFVVRRRSHSNGHHNVGLPYVIIILSLGLIEKGICFVTWLLQ